MHILGIESSCDETAAAVVVDGREVLSSVVASQVALHRSYGGVVPELASRRHIEAVVPVITQALDQSGVDRHELDAVAATQGPGLVGALLVGFSFAKALAFGLQIPFVGINHLTGHVNSLFLTPEPPVFPFVALLVSGGHTALYYVTGHTRMELMGQTRDDAAGEAFDKVAKMLGLGYPGGIVIEQLARQDRAGGVKLPRPYLDKDGFDFSFSGLKTAVRRIIESRPSGSRPVAASIAAEFQESVVDVLTFKVLRAAAEKKCPRIAVVGGVAANSRLRQRVTRAAVEAGIAVHIPPVALCGDNAAMIAAVGYHQLKAGLHSPWDEDVYSRIRPPP